MTTEPTFTVDDMHAAGLETVAAEMERDAARRECDRLRAQVADLANKLHKAQQEIASHTKAGTAWANENDKLKRQLAEQKPVVMAAEDWVELRRTCGETPNADALLRQVVGRLQNAREAEVAR